MKHHNLTIEQLAGTYRTLLASDVFNTDGTNKRLWTELEITDSTAQLFITEDHGKEIYRGGSLSRAIRHYNGEAE